MPVVDDSSPDYKRLYDIFFGKEVRKKDYYLNEYKKWLVTKQLQQHMLQAMKTLNVAYSCSIHVEFGKNGIEIIIKEISDTKKSKK